MKKEKHSYGETGFRRNRLWEEYQIEILSNFLKSQKQKVFVTREPGEPNLEKNKLFLTEKLMA